MHPLITIMVLTHNAVDVTKRFLELLYANTDNFNLVLVDNASKDETACYLKEYCKDKKNIFLSLQDKNLGIITGRNFGYSLYKQNFSNDSNFFMFLDNDQFVSKNWLQNHYTIMNKGNYDIVGVEAWLLDNNLFPIKQCKNINDSFSYVGCGGMLIKKEVSDSIGMFDEQYNPCYFEDPDYNFRAIHAGYRIGWNIKSGITHLAHQTLGKNPNKRMHFQKSWDYFRKKWKGNVPTLLKQESYYESSNIS